MQRGKSALASFKTHSHTHWRSWDDAQAQVSPQYRLAEPGLWVPACASLLSRMETSPSQGVEVPVLADQDFEDMFLADTQSRLGRGTLREHDPVASQSFTIRYQDQINNF